MVKNLILVIFISVLIISCDNQIVGWNNNENNNEDGFYFSSWNQSLTQSYQKLKYSINFIANSL